MVYILLGAGFETTEALTAADVLRRAKLPVSLAGIGGDTVTSSHNVTVRADLPVEEVTLEAGDMVVLPGGLGGVAAIEGSGAAMALIRQAAGDDKLWLAAICAAPTLLARAGLLTPGVRCVCYPGMEGALSDAGAVPMMDQSVVVEGKLITGRGPGSAFDFALALMETLADAGTAAQTRAALHYRT
ncbi:MAG: DJ-1/PfpI family protein [Clostridiales bacterium]|nr:DJ-1/PfpI family protein [Clostridiales bacterium]